VAIMQVWQSVVLLLHGRRVGLGRSLWRAPVRDRTTCEVMIIVVNCASVEQREMCLAPAILISLNRLVMQCAPECQAQPP
jgi:hypothetical protein